MKQGIVAKFRHSLVARYLLLILAALLFIPIAIPTFTIVWYSFEKDSETASINGVSLEKIWHREAEGLTNASPEEIKKRLDQIKKIYPESSLFWVNPVGNMEFSLPERNDIPSSWSATYTVDFMKKSYDGDPFTSVAFIGEDNNKGFIVFQIPRSELDLSENSLMNRYYYLFYAGVILLFALFIFISWLLFYRMRKRLMRLGKTMDQHESDGIPNQIKINKMDEIGQLEQSFNNMIDKLKESRGLQQEEEHLRRQLIANLSHDLRTPLTTLRGHLYTLQKESLSKQGHVSLQLIDHKIAYLGQLIDNLLSYTLLSTGKYPSKPESLYIFRAVRTITASWYPTFEREGFDMEINLPEKDDIRWQMDSSWLERVLDNVFQNIVRHAKVGGYIGIKGEVTEKGFKLLIIDHGPGFIQESENKGAGIGMAIISLMLKEMDLHWEMETDGDGTIIKISGEN
ncbi:cache domain-containing sensor histidine kinase [Bacillus sp. FSL K6-3431]|uniref:cache domain-containing sensor histidine kinase n=1 Tax=Bacillus sp. FSL K6-3431 TaxID=2921500 RepID=UPI0030F4E835